MCLVCREPRLVPEVRGRKRLEAGVSNLSVESGLKAQGCWREGSGMLERRVRDAGEKALGCWKEGSGMLERRLRDAGEKAHGSRISLGSES